MLTVLLRHLTRRNPEPEPPCGELPDPRVVPFPLGSEFWQERERERTDGGRSTYRNDEREAA